MPFVNILHSPDFSGDRKEQLGDAVHQALIDVFDIPPAKRIQALSAYAPDRIRFTPALVGARRSDSAFFLQITSARGRTADRRRALFAAIAERAYAMADGDHEDAIVNLIEPGREHWSGGNGLAALAA